MPLNSARGKEIAMEWISVEERLPEEGQNVLFYFEVTGVEVGHYTLINDVHYGKGNQFYNKGGFLTDDVTHWMPLPAPPAGDKDE